jgi:DNA-binding GntR family transcriptional regulator
VSVIDIFESKPLREKIADRIRSDIIKGQYKSGERLVEPKLAQMLGISRTPIREALRQLESEGFIDIVPRKGAVVKELTLKDIDDLYAIKANLEGLAAKQATGNITEKDIIRLKNINEKFHSISHKNKNVIEEYLKYNLDFHDIFIKASKNQKLIEILEGLSKNFQRFKGFLVTKAERSEEAYKEHIRIIEAFESKDEELAEKVVRQHIESGWEYLRNKIKKEVDDEGNLDR